MRTTSILSPSHHQQCSLRRQWKVSLEAHPRETSAQKTIVTSWRTSKISCLLTKKINKTSVSSVLRAHNLRNYTIWVNYLARNNSNKLILAVLQNFVRSKGRACSIVIILQLKDSFRVLISHFLRRFQQPLLQKNFLNTQNLRRITTN